MFLFNLSFDFSTLTFDLLSPLYLPQLKTYIFLSLIFIEKCKLQ
jgi:hypothetical protein